MKDLPVRKFTAVVGYLSEAVTVTLEGRPIGTYTPLNVYDRGSFGEVTEALEREAAKIGEVTVGPVEKAIEPDKVKRPPRGLPTKGLGDVPGLKQSENFGRPAPAPKPK